MLEGGACSSCKERAVIRSQVKRLEEEIIKLKEKHHTLWATMNSIHDPFIHKFPPEISIYIFYFCLPTLDFGLLHPWPQPKEMTGALKLGGICRKWRQLAWVTLNLWEMLYVHIAWVTTNSLAMSLPGLIKEWLDRSGVLPLTIFLVNDYPRQSEIKFAISQIIDVINLHSGQWQNLFLDVNANISERLSGWEHPTQLFCLELAVNGYGCPIEEVFPTFELWCAEIYFVRGNICPVRGKLVTPHIYIIYASKHLYKCANILACTEILSLCAETNLLCAETHLLCAEIYVLRGNLFIVRGNLFTVRRNLCAARKYFQVPTNFLVCARKLLCPMRGFSASNHFRNAAMP